MSGTPNSAGGPLFIVNPASGGGRTRKRMAAMQAAIERAGLTFDYVMTDARGHAEALASEAVARGRSTLVACGGDGTVNEVANAILHAGAGDVVRLGTIGMGTGKDVAKCLGLARGATAIRAIAEGHDQLVDCGRLESTTAAGETALRYFLLEASAGWVPEISQSTPRWLKRLGDTAPYLVMTGVKMVGRMGREFELRIDGAEYNGVYNSISVHNMELWGGDLTVAPGAAWDDGLLDVIRWGDLSRARVLAAVKGQQAGGTHLDIEGIDRHPARLVELNARKKSAIDIDGEFGGYLPAKIGIARGALRMLVPAATDRD